MVKDKMRKETSNVILPAEPSMLRERDEEAIRTPLGEKAEPANSRNWCDSWIASCQIRGCSALCEQELGVSIAEQLSMLALAMLAMLWKSAGTTITGWKNERRGSG